MEVLPQLDECEEIKGDLAFLLFEDGDDEIEDSVNLLSNFPNPCGIFLRINDFKDEGNRYFRSKNYVRASANYTLALKFMLFVTIRSVEDKSKFVESTLCLLSNLTISSIKLKDFVKAGQYSSVVLNYDPHNVKALYRRAMAAIELGRIDLACGDLNLASKLDPTNKEVEQLLRKASSSPVCSSLENVLALNLGFTREVNRKRPFEELVTQPCTQDQGNVNHNRDEIKNHGGKDMVWEPSSRTEELKTFDVGDLKSVNIGVAQNEVSNGVMSTVPQYEVSNGVMSTVPSTNYSFVEPKYRFTNRRRRGSSLLLSPSTYEALAHGRTLSFYNTRQGSMMSIRVISSTPQTVAHHDSENTTRGSTPPLGESVCVNDDHPMNDDDPEIVCENDDLATSVVDQATSEATLTSSDEFLGTNMAEAPFTFSSMPKRHPRHRGTSRAYRHLGKRPKRTRFVRISSQIPLFSNQVCDCRLLLGSKRKNYTAFDSLGSPPRKKLAHTSLFRCSNVETKLVDLDVGSLVGDAESCC